MEPGTPRVEIESRHKENSCLVLIRFKKSIFEPKALFKAGFNIESEHDVKYLQRFLSDVFRQWRFFHPSQEEVSTDSFSESSASPFFSTKFFVPLPDPVQPKEHTTLFCKYIYKLFTFILYYLTL